MFCEELMLTARKEEMFAPPTLIAALGQLTLSLTAAMTRGLFNVAPTQTFKADCYSQKCAQLGNPD